MRHQNKRVLDLGSRDKLLKKYLPKDTIYQGIDFKDGEEVKGWNLEQGIPFEDKSFDVIFALDVLEHVENIHSLMDEILRVAKNEVIITLPNIYYWRYRIKFLFGKELSGKYSLPLNKTLDRHRWLTSYLNAIKFIRYKAGSYKVRVFFGKTSNFLLLSSLEKVLQRAFPNFAAHTIFYHIDLGERAVGDNLLEKN
ncbi:MAG: methionine biosynthesis protein MetW [Thermodesulfobacteriota bacterium]